jgi:hypothetical protein
MLAALAGILAAGAFFGLSAVVRGHALRGTVVALVLGLHCFAWSPLVPQAVCDAVVVASLVLLLLTAASPRSPGGLRVAAGPVLLVAVFVGASVTTAVAFPPGLGLVLRTTLLAGLVVAVLAQAAPADRRRLVDGVVVVAVLQGLAGLVEVVRGEPLLWGYKVYATGRGLWNENHLLGGDAVRVQGTMSHALPYGALLMVGLVLLLTTWRRRGPGPRWSALVLLGTCLVLSGSRSAVVATVVALAYLLASSRRAATWQRGSILVAAAVAVVLVSWTEIVQRADELLSSGSFLNRAGHFPAVPRLVGRPVLEAFFGSGEGSEGRLFAQGYFFGTGFNVVDNQLLSSLATQGVLGAGLVVAALVVSAVRGGRDVRACLMVFTSGLMTFDAFKMTTMVLLLAVVVCLSDRRWGAQPGEEADRADAPREAEEADEADQADQADGADEADQADDPSEAHPVDSRPRTGRRAASRA